MHKAIKESLEALPLEQLRMIAAGGVIAAATLDSHDVAEIDRMARKPTRPLLEALFRFGAENYRGNRPDDFGPHGKCRTCGGIGRRECEACAGSGVVSDDTPFEYDPLLAIAADWMEVRHG